MPDKSIAQLDTYPGVGLLPAGALLPVRNPVDGKDYKATRDRISIASHQQNTDSGTNGDTFEIGQYELVDATGEYYRGILINKSEGQGKGFLGARVQDASGQPTFQLVQCRNFTPGSTANVFEPLVPAAELTGTRDEVRQLLTADQIDAKRIYRITGRPDGQDVLVRGLNAAGLAYADAYTVPAGADAPQTPVSYDISTDTVSPRASGGGGDPTLPGRVSTLETDLDQAENDINTLENEVDNLAEVARSGDYNDLTNTPTLLTLNYLPNTATADDVELRTGAYYYGDYEGMYQYIGPDRRLDYYINPARTDLWQAAILSPLAPRDWKPVTEYPLNSLAQLNGILAFAASYHTAGASLQADINAGRWALVRPVDQGVINTAALTQLTLSAFNFEQLRVQLGSGSTVVTFTTEAASLFYPFGHAFRLIFLNFDPARVQFTSRLTGVPDLSGYSGWLELTFRVGDGNVWAFESVRTNTPGGGSGGGVSQTYVDAADAALSARIDETPSYAPYEVLTRDGVTTGFTDAALALAQLTQERYQSLLIKVDTIEISSRVELEVVSVEYVGYGRCALVALTAGALAVTVDSEFSDIYVETLLAEPLHFEAGRITRCTLRQPLLVGETFPDAEQALVLDSTDIEIPGGSGHWITRGNPQSSELYTVILRGNTTLPAGMTVGPGITIVDERPTPGTGGGSSYTDEQAQDAAAALLLAGGHTGISFVYDDTLGRIAATVTVSGNAPTNKLTLTDEIGGERGLTVRQFNNGPQSAPVNHVKARGTAAAPANIVPGDLIGLSIYSAYMNGAFTSDRALFGALADSATGIALAFMAGTSDGNYRPTLRVGGDQKVYLGDFGSAIPFSLENLVERVNVAGRVYLRNQSEPATPAGGGVVYVENGALKFKGSNGTVTTIANA